MEENYYNDEEIPEGMEMFMERPKNKKPGFFNRLFGFFKKLITFKWFSSEEFDLSYDDAKRLSESGYESLYVPEKSSTPAKTTTTTTTEKTEETEKTEKTEETEEIEEEKKETSSNETQEETIEETVSKSSEETEEERQM